MKCKELIEKYQELSERENSLNEILCILYVKNLKDSNDDNLKPYNEAIEVLDKRLSQILNEMHKLEAMEVKEP